jgi:hypothetical protein
MVTVLEKHIYLTIKPRDSISEIKRLVRQHDSLLREIAANTLSTRRTHAVDAPTSILEADDDKESVFSELIDTDDTSFDTVILNTKVYSNAFTGVLGPGSHDDESDDARTIIETQSVSHTTTPVTETVARAPKDTTEAYNLAIDAPEIRSAIQNLGVTDIQAVVMFDHIARSNRELSFSQPDLIYNVQQVTTSQYHGRCEKSPGGWGQFDRRNVVIHFRLGEPLSIRTVEDCHNPNKKCLTYERGEILLVEVSIIVSHISRYI